MDYILSGDIAASFPVFPLSSLPVFVPVLAPVFVPVFPLDYFLPFAGFAGSFPVGSFPFGSYRFGSYRFGSGSFRFGSFGSFPFPYDYQYFINFGSGTFACIEEMSAFYEENPLNVYGYGIDLI